jgi:uncharacterized protein DUF4328
MGHVDDAQPAPYSMSPVGDEPAAPLQAARRATGYRSPRTRARWALVLLGITIALDMVSLFALGEERSLLNRGVGQISLSEWQASSARVSDISLLELVVLLFTAIAFLLWLHRCYVNLRELGTRNLRFTPGWAVGYWFIPIMNLFRPKQILDELWRATSPTGTDEKTWLTTLWLLAFLGAALTTRIALAAGTDTFSDLKFTNSWEMVSAFADIAAAAFAYRLVSTLTARQEARVA